MKLNKNLAISESGFVFDASTGESYSANETGLKILSMIRDGLDDKEIERRLLEEYDVVESALDKHLMDFVAILKQYRLFESTDK